MIKVTFKKSKNLPYNEAKIEKQNWQEKTHQNIPKSVAGEHDKGE